MSINVKRPVCSICDGKGHYYHASFKRGEYDRVECSCQKPADHTAESSSAELAYIQKQRDIVINMLGGFNPSADLLTKSGLGVGILIEQEHIAHRAEKRVQELKAKLAQAKEILSEVASLATDQKSSPKQCSVVVMAMDWLSGEYKSEIAVSED